MGEATDAISVGATALGDLFMAAAERYRERPALWVEGEFLSYRELEIAAERIACAILATPDARNAAPVRHCALLVDRSGTGYAAILGALLAGFAYVPLNPRFPADRLRRVLAASDANVLIIDAASIDVARPVITDSPVPLWILLPDLESPPSWMAGLGDHRILCRPDLAMVPDAPAQPANPDGGAYLLFTSGSTGQPKGVLIRHRNALAYVGNALSRYRVSPHDRFTQLFDFSFDLSVHDMFVCWSAGACLYCPPASALTGLRDFVRKHELTFWFSVPSTAAYMSRMRMLLPGSFPSLRMSLFCGEALPTSLAALWRQAAPSSAIENLYGPTETTIAITAHRLPGNDGPEIRTWPTVPIGDPLPGQHAAIVGPDGYVVPDGEAGELYLAGSQVANGYWRLPEMTASRFACPQGLPADAPRHWYRTGDRVVRDPQCGLVFLGRLDHEAKIRGYRVDLHEIEAVVRAAAGSESVAALPWPADDDATPTRSVAVFIAGQPTATTDIVVQCRAKLPPAVVPRHIYFVPEWPLTANGKTNYAALKQRMKDGQC